MVSTVRFKYFVPRCGFQEHSLQTQFPSPLKLHAAHLQVNAHMATKNYKDFVEANETFKKGFNEGGKEMPPARKAAILTCMDSRDQLPPLPALPLMTQPIALATWPTVPRLAFTCLMTDQSAFGRLQGCQWTSSSDSRLDSDTHFPVLTTEDHLNAASDLDTNLPMQIGDCNIIRNAGTALEHSHHSPGY